MVESLAQPLPLPGPALVAVPPRARGSQGTQPQPVQTPGDLILAQEIERGDAEDHAFDNELERRQGPPESRAALSRISAVGWPGGVLPKQKLRLTGNCPGETGKEERRKENAIRLVLCPERLLCAQCGSFGGPFSVAEDPGIQSPVRRQVHRISVRGLRKRKHHAGATASAGRRHVLESGARTVSIRVRADFPDACQRRPSLPQQRVLIAFHDN